MLALSRKHSTGGLLAAVFATALSLINIGSVRADTFILTNEGQISGELVNRDEKPRQKYIIKQGDGATLTFDRSQIKQVVPENAAQQEYEKIRPTFADTPEDQTKLADWCKQHNLTRARMSALERVIELDTDNKDARRALGYFQHEGRWVQSDQLRKENGFVYYQGKWLMPQEIEVLEQRHKDEVAQRQWYGTIGRLRNWLRDPAKADLAREELQHITDPAAAPALATALDGEQSRQVRIWCVLALGRLGAVKTLVDHSLDDTDEEVRLACIDQLAGSKSAGAAVPLYAAGLKSKDNVRVNRAGMALGRLGDKSAIPPLIDAVVTTHKFQIVQGSGNSGQMSAGFSPTGGGGMTMGSAPPQIVHRDLQNQQVLDALVALAGGVNFGFDKQAWKNWYATQHTPAAIDARRD